MFCGLLVLLLQLLFEHDVDNKEVKIINKNIVKCFFIVRILFAKLFIKLKTGLEN